jgi:DNA polymerase-3 subunit delta'
VFFDNVIGQEEIKQQLLGLEANNRLSHAILFIGKDGSGALPLAMGFAQHLVSIARAKPAPKPVEVVDLFGGLSALPVEESEQAFSPDAGPALNLVHPDLHFSYPVIPKKSDQKPIATDYISQWREFYKLMPYGNVFDWLQFINAENKQGNITAEECNDIIRKLSLKPFQAACKVLLMWMPEYLGKEGNKLLKLIEEPPPDTIFLLVAESEDQLLQTIISRCQLIKVPPLHESDIEQALISRANVSEDKARQAALVCEGNYREALQLLQHSHEDWSSLLREWLNAILIRGAKGHNRFRLQSDVIDQLAALGREKQKQFLKYFLQLLEQSIRLHFLGEANLALPEQEKQFAARLNNISGISTQKAIAEELNDAIYYIERNAHAKMLFQALSIKLRSIVLDKTVLLTG